MMDGSTTLSAPVFDLLKPWLNVQAEAILAGYRADLLEGDDGRPLLIISRWALTRSFNNISEARAWLTLVTGRAA